MGSSAHCSSSSDSLHHPGAGGLTEVTTPDHHRLQLVAHIPSPAGLGIWLGLGLGLGLGLRSGLSLRQLSLVMCNFVHSFCDLQHKLSMRVIN